MSNSKKITVRYRVIRSVEKLYGETRIMYGVEGRCGEDILTLSALSEDRRRVAAMVKNLNRGEFELCLLRDAVNDFLYQTYGIEVV